jgi:hypothetical protein
LLHQQIQVAIEAEKRDGRRRHFAYPWHVVAQSNPAYGRFVEGERERLGPEHPMFTTQFELRPLGQEAGLFTRAMVEAMRGTHRRRERAEGDGTWVAGLDVAGASEEPTGVSGIGFRASGDGERGAGGEARVSVDEGRAGSDAAVRERAPRRDSTVLTIGRVEWVEVGLDDREPVVEVEGVYWWTGRSHEGQRAELATLLRHDWHVSKLAIDKTGIGAPLAEFLTLSLGEDVVDSIAFSASRKSELGYQLLAAAGGGRLRWYAHGADDREATEWWHEVECARREVTGNRQMRFYVPETSGHDDFLSSVALLVEAAKSSTGPAVSAVIAATDPDRDWRMRFRD